MNRKLLSLLGLLNLLNLSLRPNLNLNLGSGLAPRSCRQQQ